MGYQLTGNVPCSEVGVILPTYKEAENISRLIDDITDLSIDASILVIDDSSPDGTAKVVQEKQKSRSNILLCVRPSKGGLGTAITDGFKIYLSSKCAPKYIVTMDADYSHNPKNLPQLLACMKDHDCAIVIGSRYCEGGATAGWPFGRKLVSKTANFIAREILGIKMCDCTSGYRCYSTRFLREAIGSLHSHTYEIQIETVRQAMLRRFRVVETPILFMNRKHGKSKLTWNEIEGYLSYTLKAALHS